MSRRENPYPLSDFIAPKNALLSVDDKDNLEFIVESLLEINSDMVFYATGGTGRAISSILGNRSQKNYMSVEDFTGTPEMDGDLVKTIHPKIASGLLAERDNPNHERYFLEEMTKYGLGPGFYFDILVCNLYPFAQTIAKSDCTPEIARNTIDIGGPGMIMAAAKNWHSSAVFTNPWEYSDRIDEMIGLGGGTNLEMRFDLAQNAFCMVGEYRDTIGKYFAKLDYESDILPTLNIKK